MPVELISAEKELELRQERGTHIKSIKYYLDKAEEEHRSLTKDEQKSIDNLERKISKICNELGEIDLTNLCENDVRAMEEYLFDPKNDPKNIPGTVAYQRRMLREAGEDNAQPVGGSQVVEKRDYTILASNEKLSTHETRTLICGEPSENFNVGRAVTGLLRNNFQGFEFEKRALLSASNEAAAGILLDRAVSTRIIDMARAQSVCMRAGAQTVPIPGNPEAYSIAVATSDPEMGWVRELEALPESGISFGNITFRPNDLGCIIDVTEKIWSAPNAPSVIEAMMYKAMALAIDKSILEGGPNGFPIGLATDTGINEHAIDTSNGAPTYEYLFDRYCDLLELNCPEKISLIMAVRNKKNILKLKDGNGRYLADGTNKMPLLWDNLTDYTSTQLTTNRGTGGNENHMYMGDMREVYWGVFKDIAIEITNSRYSPTVGDTFAKRVKSIRIYMSGDVNFGRRTWLTRITGVKTW